MRTGLLVLTPPALARRTAAEDTDDDRGGFVPGFSLQGPVPIEATAGNAWPEWPPRNTSRPR
jgi:hypothetical protein